MSKSMEEVLKKELKKLHMQLAKDNSDASELYTLFDEARFIANCRNCEMEAVYSKMVFEDRYRSCRKVDTCSIVCKIVDKIKQAEEKISRTREKYGKKLFEILAKYHPVLTSGNEQAEKPFDEVFGFDYSKLTEEEKVSLIALVEHDGGLYQFRENVQLFEE